MSRPPTMAIGTSSGSRRCDPMRPACRTERRGSRSHAIYGFRPGRRAQDAIAEIHHLISRPAGYGWVVEGDITACFDEIDHPALLQRVRRRITDKRVLALIKAFCKGGILTQDGATQDTITGTPQGGILSPLLANIALSVLDEHF